MQCQRAAAQKYYASIWVNKEVFQENFYGYVSIFIQNVYSYVKHHLKYCVQVWCPYLANDIDVMGSRSFCEVRAT